MTPYLVKFLKKFKYCLEITYFSCNLSSIGNCVRYLFKNSVIVTINELKSIVGFLVDDIRYTELKLSSSSFKYIELKPKFKSS